MTVANPGPQQRPSGDKRARASAGTGRLEAARMPAMRTRETASASDRSCPAGSPTASGGLRGLRRRPWGSVGRGEDSRRVHQVVLTGEAESARCLEPAGAVSSGLAADSRHLPPSQQRTRNRSSDGPAFCVAPFGPRRERRAGPRRRDACSASRHDQQSRRHDEPGRSDRTDHGDQHRDDHERRERVHARPDRTPERTVPAERLTDLSCPHTNAVGTERPGR